MDSSASSPAPCPVVECQVVEVRTISVDSWTAVAMLKLGSPLKSRGRVLAGTISLERKFPLQGVDYFLRGRESFYHLFEDGAIPTGRLGASRSLASRKKATKELLQTPRFWIDVISFRIARFPNLGGCNNNEDK